MKPVSLSLDDLAHHVVKFGIDIYPPVDLSNERTRLNMFSEAVCDRWPELYERLVVSDREFSISKSFARGQARTDPTLEVNTFVITNRGPVFIFPLLLPDPVGATGLEGSFLDLIKEIRQLLFQALLERKIMRVGLVRDLVFMTGSSPCLDILAKQATFAKAELISGRSIRSYRDERCNVRITIDTVELMKTTQMPVGKRVEEPVGAGLRVALDVNNTEVRPMAEADIEEVVERAVSLWPEQLLEYITGERSSS